MGIFRWGRDKDIPRPADEPLTFERLRLANRLRSESPSGFDQAITAFTASDRIVELVGELGEAANALKKLNRIQSGGARVNKETADQLRAKLRLELGDTLISLDLVCQRLGFKLGELAIESFDSKSAEIGYKGRL